MSIREQIETQAVIDRQKAELAAKRKALEHAERQIRLKVLSSRTVALAAIDESIDPEMLATMDGQYFNWYLAERTETFKQCKAAEAESEKAKLAALAPDREKLAVYADAVMSIPLPQLSAECSRQQERLTEWRQHWSQWLNDMINELGKTST